MVRLTNNVIEESPWTMMVTDNVSLCEKSKEEAETKPESCSDKKKKEK